MRQALWVDDLLSDLDAFFTEHGRCGDPDAGVDCPVVWIACDCGADVAVDRTRTTLQAGIDLDARGRRLRAALAAVLVRDKAPELRLMHEWLDTWHEIREVAALTFAMQDL